MNAAANFAQKQMGDMPTTTTANPDVNEGKTMRALAWFGNKDVRMIDAPVPAITEPKDAIIRVTGSTVCGSDLHLYHKEILQLQEGDIIGHEFMGVVDEVGSAVTKIKPGDRVVASFQIACGECDYCKRGLSSMCDTTNSSSVMDKLYGKKFAGLFGYAHFSGGFAGGQAEMVRCPFADTNLLVIPDEVPDEKALYLSDIIPTSYHCVEYTGVTKGSTVGIWGLGPIGLLVARWCQLKGCKRIIGIDNVPARIQHAQKVLGIETLDFDEKTDVVGALKEMVPEGLDFALDCAAFRYAKSMVHKVQRAIGLETDTSETVNEAIQSVKKFGSIGLIADYAALTNGFLLGGIMEMGIKLIGCGQAPVQMYWKDLLEALKDGSFDPIPLVLTHRFDIEEFPELYKAFDEKKAGIMKTFVQTKFSAPPAKGAPKLSKIADVLG